MDGVRSFPYADEHDFAFTIAATDKTNGSVVLERMEICDNVHVYVDLVTIRGG
jgi:hypothetical protein